ncbi:MAG: hypothetical protein HQL74_14210 [Magnetococcales bacterium]|nr:hypothetical protein [Magnetococcales bacterium]
MLKTTAMVALVVPLWVAASGCGGGGSGGSGGSSSSSSTTVSGAVIDGPVSGGTVIIKDSNGNMVATGVTGSDGKYSLTIPSGTSFPLHVNTTGGTDLVTEEAAASMDSLIMDATQTTANITPITSVVYQTAVANAGGLGKVTSDAVTSAKSTTLSMFGFGIDSEESGIDPISSSVHSGNISSFMKSAEAMAEMVRRAVGTGSTTMVQVFKVMGEDLVDGSMDGKKSGAALSAEMPTGFTSDTIVSAVTQQKALVGAEMVNNSLKVTQANGTQISSDDAKTRFSRAMNRMDPSISTTDALSKMEAVLISEKQKNQLTTDIGNAKTAQETLGADSAAMASLQTVANNLEVGKAGANKLDTSVMTTAEGAANTVTKGIRENTYSATVVSSAVSAVSPSSTSTIATTPSTASTSSSSSTTASTSEIPAASSTLASSSTTTYAGSYKGTWSVSAGGGSSQEWTLTVDASGLIAGASTDGSTLSGTMSAVGSITMKSYSGGIVQKIFSGTVTESGIIGGTWTGKVVEYKEMYVREQGAFTGYLSN